MAFFATSYAVIVLYYTKISLSSLGNQRQHVIHTWQGHTFDPLRNTIYSYITLLVIALLKLIHFLYINYYNHNLGIH